MVAEAITMRACFDVLVYKLYHDNWTVGLIESVRGISALVVAIPIGILADTKDRVVVLKIAAVYGIIASIFALWAVLDGSLAYTLPAAVLLGSSKEFNCTIVMSVFTDSMPSHQRASLFGVSGMLRESATLLGMLVGVYLFDVMGNTWSKYSLRIILIIGFGLVRPASCIPLLMYSPAPHVKDAKEAYSAIMQDGGKLQKYRRFVPHLVATHGLMRNLASGMSVQFFALFWNMEYGMSPKAVLAVQIAELSSTVVGIYVLTKFMVKHIGQAPLVMAAQMAGILGYLVLAEADNLHVSIIACVLRVGIVTGVQPILRSIVMDYTPTEQRGIWNSIESIASGMWSGSALLGGMLVDRHGYRFTYLITSVLFSVGAMMLLPLLCLVPRSQPSKLTCVADRCEKGLKDHEPAFLACPVSAMRPGADFLIKPEQERCEGMTVEQMKWDDEVNSVGRSRECSNVTPDSDECSKTSWDLFHQDCGMDWNPLERFPIRGRCPVPLNDVLAQDLKEDLNATIETIHKVRQESCLASLVPDGTYAHTHDTMSWATMPVKLPQEDRVYIPTDLLHIQSLREILSNTIKLFREVSEEQYRDSWMYLTVHISRNVPVGSQQRLGGIHVDGMWGNSKQGLGLEMWPKLHTVFSTAHPTKYYTEGFEPPQLATKDGKAPDYTVNWWSKMDHDFKEIKGRDMKSNVLYAISPYLMHEAGRRESLDESATRVFVRVGQCRSHYNGPHYAVNQRLGRFRFIEDRRSKLDDFPKWCDYEPRPSSVGKSRLGGA